MNIILSVLLCCFIVLLYFVPGLIASWRECKSANWIALINFFFGWTVLVWVMLLIWSICGQVKEKEKVYFGKSKGWD